MSLLTAARGTVVVIGTSILLITAVHNSLHRHMTELWGASTQFWQLRWSYLFHDLAGGSDFVIFMGVFVISFLFFWLFNAFFIFLELTGNPMTILQYRIQADKKPPVVEWNTFVKCVKLILVNQLVYGLLAHFAFYPMVKLRGGAFDEQLPVFHRCMAEVVGHAIFFELSFYYIHRLLHKPFWYRHVHKVHHEWTAPISISAIYCHPLEYVFANLVPVLGGSLVFGSHIVTTTLWVVITLASTSVSHCGFHLPFMPSNESHDFHHSQFNQNFGMLGVLDQLHGTDNRFRASKSYERHSVLLSTTPANVLIPDERKKCH